MLNFYDVKKPVTLSLDASSEGIGAVILQGLWCMDHEHLRTVNGDMLK